MKTFWIIIILHTLAIKGLCQVKSDVIYFYGYDITRSKVTDPKRANQELGRYMLELVAALNEGINLKKMNRWMEPKVVEFKQNAMFEVNREVKTDNIFYPNYDGKFSLTKDSIEKIIKSYPIKEQSGTGFAVIFDVFSKDKHGVTGHGCLFDVKSRDIIKYSTSEFRDANSYNRFSDFWVPATGLVKTFCDQFAE